MEKKMNARKKAQRAARLRKQRNRRIALTLCLMFVVAFASIGGTIAWLTAQSGEVTNTFTVGDINIKLEETWNTDSDNDGKNDKWEAKLVPGTEYAKDPKVTVVANSEPCWLFVEVTETNNPAAYLNYTFKSEGWTKGTGTGEGGNSVPTNVYYREVETKANDQYWYLLTGTDTNANGAVTVKDTIVKQGTTSTTNPVMPSADNAPSITFKAYACQQANRTVAEAWDVVKPIT